MTRHNCCRCGAGLTGDEIALHRKLISRQAREYLCLDCLAAGLGVPRVKLEQLIDYYHRSGVCALFAPYEEGTRGGCVTKRHTA